MGLDAKSALKVAIADNLVYGLFFIPYWFANSAVGIMRVALWATRLTIAVLIIFIGTLATRNGTITSHAICYCRQEKVFNMEYSPEGMQPTCATRAQGYKWALCESLPTATTSASSCWPNTTECCKSYLNARVHVGQATLQAAIDSMGTDDDALKNWNFTKYSDKEMECDTSGIGWVVENILNNMLRWFLAEPIVNSIAKGRYFFGKCPMIVRAFLLTPWLVFLPVFFLRYYNILYAQRVVFGVSTDDVGLESSVFTSLVVSLLFFDLIKSTVWKMQFGSEEEDLDENGLPVIDNSAKLKVGAS
jgi:hypothetical protein